MTPEEKKIYYLRFRRFQQIREKLFAQKINSALNEQYKQFINNYDRHGEKAVEMISSEGMTKVLTELYFDCAINYGAKIRADLTKHKEVKSRQPIGFSERMHELVKQYFGTDILNQSEGITQTTKELIREVFTNAYLQGLGINDIIIQFKNTELSRVRARLIARTETVTAANAGAHIVAKDSKLKLIKGWIATKDNRTRPDHREVDGQKTGMDDYFNVGGYDMLVPGDRGGKNGKASVPAKEVCNCRCTVIYEPMRDANGRLVRETP